MPPARCAQPRQLAPLRRVQVAERARDRRQRRRRVFERPGRQPCERRVGLQRRRDRGHIGQPRRRAGRGWRRSPRAGCRRRAGGRGSTAPRRRRPPPAPAPARSRRPARAAACRPPRRARGNRPARPESRPGTPPRRPGSRCPPAWRAAAPAARRPNAGAGRKIDPRPRAGARTTSAPGWRRRTRSGGARPGSRARWSSAACPARPGPIARSSRSRAAPASPRIPATRSAWW